MKNEKPLRERSKPLVIAVITLIALLALSSLILFSKQFVGKVADEGLAPEINSQKAPVNTPIFIKAFYQGEREQFEYDPHFVPNTVTFDLNNRPYIRTHEGILQFLNPGGTWKKVDLVAEAQKSFAKKMAADPKWKAQWHSWNGWWPCPPKCKPNCAKECAPNDPLIRSGEQNDERVVFDNSGDAYTILHTGMASNIDLHMLLHSRDHGYTWEVYPIPKTESGCDARLEHQDGYNNLENPPGILVYCHFVDPQTKKVKSILTYLDIDKKQDGTLKLEEVKIVDDAYLGVGSSSFPNYMVTSGELTHFVYTAGNFEQNKKKPEYDLGVNQMPDFVRTYAKTYNHNTKKLSGPVFLGNSPMSTMPKESWVPDDHEYPGICIDSKGILHVIIGAHGRQFRYTYSVKPNDISKWTEPVGIGEPDKGEYTYVEMACDSKDTIHVIARSSGITNNYKLVYMQKKSGQDWTTFSTSEEVPGEKNYDTLKHRTLLFPWHRYYGNWYHKLNLDRKGRLFVNYVSYFDNLFSDELEAYQKKWPAETLVKDNLNCVNNPSNANKRTSPACPGLDCVKVLWPPEGKKPMEVSKQCANVCPNTNTISKTCQEVCNDHLCWYSRSVKAHDPAIIFSDDGGDTWRLATTKDFLSGMEFCGNGEIELGEQCDDGNSNNNDGCLDNCKNAICGDGFKGPGEQCDDGNQDNTDSCTNECKNAICGDGFKGPGEQCDDGNQDNTDSCTNECKNAICGDGFKGPGEECDDGNSNNNDGCSSVCKTEKCGDNIIQVGEQCEPPNTNSCDANCKNKIKQVVCGNDIKEEGEVCDITDFGGKSCFNFTDEKGVYFDGGKIQCSQDCKSFDTSKCNPAGEGKEKGQKEGEEEQKGGEQQPREEEKGISPKQPAICGNGKVELPEQCDDGNLDNNDGCNQFCQLELSKEEVRRESKQESKVEVAEDKVKVAEETPIIDNKTEGKNLTLTSYAPQNNNYKTEITADVDLSGIELTAYTVLRDANGVVLVIQTEKIPGLKTGESYVLFIPYSGNVASKHVLVYDKLPGGKVFAEIEVSYK
ncbi:MAG: DUF4215 domain-containing protein [Nanoarchaeota archaeon]